MNKLYIIEGADGTGKSTLGKAIAEQTKGHILHASFDKEWNIKEYHDSLFKATLTLLEYQDVIMDRWATSEEVYAEAYRGGKKYASDDYIIDTITNSRMSNPEDIRFIYCSNENTVKNHEANQLIREEMFEDISPVIEAYEKYMGTTALDWINYDFNKMNMDDFVKEITQ